MVNSGVLGGVCGWWSCPDDFFCCCFVFFLMLQIAHPTQLPGLVSQPAMMLLRDFRQDGYLTSRPWPGASRPRPATDSFGQQQPAHRHCPLNRCRICRSGSKMGNSARPRTCGVRGTESLACRTRTHAVGLSILLMSVDADDIPAAASRPGGESACLFIGGDIA
jgi:hypothetical protein